MSIVSQEFLDINGLSHYNELINEQIPSLIVLTQAAYNALTETQKNDPNKYYYISDSTSVNANVLTDLEDVNIQNPANGNVLTYNAVTSTWENKPSQGGGGVYLGDVSGASVTTTAGTPSVTLKWTDPSDLILDGVTIAEWAGTKVVRKIGSAPADENDGTIVIDSKTRNQYSSTGYIDINLDYEVTYYYRFFPYTTKNLYTAGTSLNIMPDRIIIPVPTVNGSLTYNGIEQTMTFDNYNAFQIDAINISGTRAINYTAQFTPKIDYKWTDGTRVTKEVAWSIAVANVTVPTLSGNYTYTGEEQTVNINEYNSNIIAVSGNTGTNAGTYTVTFHLISDTDSVWSDSTTADKTDTWSISKAAAAVTTTPTSITFDANSSKTATVTLSNPTGTITGVSSSASSIVSATLSGNSMTLECLQEKSGDVEISISIDESTNYNAGTIIFNITCDFLALVSWSSGTDEQITAMINAYYNGDITLADIQSVWSIGDTRSINLSSISTSGTYNNNSWSVGESHRAQTVELQILDFNHDNLTTSINGITKALITVDQKNCLRDASVTDDTGSSNTEHGYMESSNTNANGWRNCKRRIWCNGGYYQALPEYLRNLIKPVNKLTSAGNQSSTIYTDSDYIFLLSEIEIFGSTTYSKSGEGSQYAWYANATTNRYKLPKWSSSRVSDIWWERSPRGSGATYFCAVSTGGNADRDAASGARGLAPACCL